MKRLTAIFLQSLLALLPLAVTVFLFIWLGTAAERMLSIAIKWVLPNGWYVTGMGVAGGVVLIFLVGLLVNIWGVPRLIRFGERFVERIPLVKTIYGAVCDLLGFFSKSGEVGAVSQVVMVSIGETGRVVGLLAVNGSTVCRRDSEVKAMSPCTCPSATRSAASPSSCRANGLNRSTCPSKTPCALS
jgi:uncharacterized membrane protein